MEENTLETITSKKKIVYHAIILVLIFNLIIVSSFAWFVSNRIASVNNTVMSLEVDDTIAIYRAYLCDPDTGVGYCRIGEDLINITNLDLNQYDTLFRGKNINTAAFAQINLLGKESMPESGTLHITIDCSPEATNPDAPSNGSTSSGSKLKEYTSNIARFTAFIYPDNDNNTATLPPDAAILDDPSTTADDNTAAAQLFTLINTQERYTAVEKYSVKNDDLAHSKTFVTFSGTGHTKSTSITISVDYKKGDWYEVVENGVKQKYLNVYLYITYDVELIDYYFAGFDNEMLDPSKPGIPFENDLEKITISYDK